MKRALPFPHGMDTHRFGLAALLLGVLMPATAGLIAYAVAAPRAGEDARSPQFVRAAAGIEDGIRLMRGLAKHLLAGRASPEKSAYYRMQHDAVRERVALLVARAPALAADARERARLAGLAALVRVADARLARVLATARIEDKQHLAMREAGDTVVQSKGEK